MSRRKLPRAYVDARPRSLPHSWCNPYGHNRDTSSQASGELIFRPPAPASGLPQKKTAAPLAGSDPQQTLATSLKSNRVSELDGTLRQTFPGPPRYSPFWSIRQTLPQVAKASEGALSGVCSQPDQGS